MHIVSKAYWKQENFSIVIISLSLPLKLAKAAVQMTISQFRKCSAVPPKWRLWPGVGQKQAGVKQRMCQALLCAVVNQVAHSAFTA